MSVGPLNAASVAWRRQALLAQWERSCDLTTFGFAPRSQTVRKRTQSTFFVQSIDKKDQLLILFTCLEPVHRQTRGHHQPLDPPLRRAHARLRDHGDGRSPLLLCITRLHPLPFLLPELQVKSLQRLRLSKQPSSGCRSRAISFPTATGSISPLPCRAMLRWARRLDVVVGIFCALHTYGRQLNLTGHRSNLYDHKKRYERGGNSGAIYMAPTSPPS